MKKALLASTAIVTAAALASPASAADRIKLSLGGFMEQYIGFASNEDDNVAGAAGRDMAVFDQQNDNEVYFSGSTTLDNGIKIAVRIELEGDAAAGTQMDEAWMDIQTNWGTLRLGEDDPVNDLQIVEPKSGILDDYNTWVNPGEGVGGSFNVGRNNFGGSGGSAIDDSYITAGDDNVILYLSPKLAGFQVGFSYTPEIFQNGDNIPNRVTDASGAYSATLNWSGKIMEVGIDAGYAWYKEMGSGTGASTAAAGPSSALTSHQFGLNLAYAGFGVGGNYGRYYGTQSKGTNFDIPGDDGHMWQAGVWYETGPIGVGFLHKYQQNEGATGGTGSAGREDESTVDGVWFNYTISDGVRWESMIFHADFDEESGVDASENSGGWGVVGGLRLDF